MFKNRVVLLQKRSHRNVYAENGSLRVFLTFVHIQTFIILLRITHVYFI